MTTVTTPLRLADLMDRSLHAEMLAAGYIRTQTHPTLPLVVHNYTEKAAYEGVWNEVTRQCRGLITDTSGQVIARPFAKFFNHGQQEAGVLPLDARAVVTDKQDGSLGILVPDGIAGHLIATRGSFTSDQAIHATQVWADRYAGVFTPDPTLTYLYEVIFPTNRIVIDYYGLDDLVLLGAVETKTGRNVPLDELADWPGPRTEQFAAATLAEALALPPRPNAEGVVVYLPQQDIRVKIKQADYLALHKLVTGLNARVVWERLGEGVAVADLCAPLPDEFHGWVEQVASELLAERGRIIGEAQAEYRRIVASLPDGWSRKDYALIAAKSPHRGYLFLLLDGNTKKLDDAVWRAVRPSGDRSLVATGEDVA